jgi:hypothetical protein
MSWSARWAVLGLGLLLLGAVLALVRLVVLAVVVLVLAAAAFRARAWVRKARLLGEVGRSFHVPEEDEDR